MTSNDQSNAASSEPWLQAPNVGSFTHSTGFASFLKENLQKLSFNADFAQSVQQEHEILLKIKQLEIYNNLVSHLFSTEDNNNNSSFEQKNFLNKFNSEIFPKTAKTPQIVSANINKQLYQILTTANNNNNNEMDFETKSQSSETINEKTEFSLNENRIGYILTKSLRKVVRESEQREIFLAQKCFLSLNENNILTNLKLDNSSQNNNKVIVKFVAKFKNNNFLNNKLRNEFSTQFLLSFFNSQNFDFKINEQIEFFENEETIISVSHFAGSTDILDFLNDSISSDLSNQIDFLNNLNNFKDKIEIILQMAEAVRICHNVSVSHRDISLENFVLKQNVQNDQNLRKDNLNNKFETSLIDFGHSGNLLKNNLTKFEGLLGKLNYISPELFELHEKYQNNKLNKNTEKVEEFYNSAKSDIFSLGVCFYMILTKTQLFVNNFDAKAENSGNLSEEEVFERVKSSFEELNKNIFELNVSEDFESFEEKNKLSAVLKKTEEIVINCLRYEEKERFEVNELCESLKKVKKSLESL